MEFIEIKLIVKNEKEKEELIRTCQYLHDFSVIWKNTSKRCKIDVVKSWNKSIPTERIDTKKYSGVSLDLESFPILNFLTGLAECDDNPNKEKHLNDHIIIEKE